jgi:hypothetical protein
MNLNILWHFSTTETKATTGQTSLLVGNFKTQTQDGCNKSSPPINKNITKSLNLNATLTQGLRHTTPDQRHMIPGCVVTLPFSPMQGAEHRAI